MNVTWGDLLVWGFLALVVTWGCGCGPVGVSGTAWRNDAGECREREELHRNGLWEERCYEGTGVLIWLDYTC